MPTGAVWTLEEEKALVQFLVDHKSEAGDGAAFKGQTYQKALAHISPLRERGTVKNVKTLQNKWTALKKIYRVIIAIQSVSGWVWDDKKGANINAHSASSWDDYVKKHPAAKPFRNKGWAHLTKVALIMPSTASGANVFVPSQDNTLGEDNDDEDNDDDNSDQATFRSQAKTPPADAEKSSDEDETPPLPILGTRKRAREPATPTRPAVKRVRGSKNTTALESMSSSLAAFGTTIATALAGPPSARIDPTPVWLEEDELVALIDFLRTDLTAADTYITLTGSDVRRSWVRAQLRKLNVVVD